MLGESVDFADGTTVVCGEGGCKEGDGGEEVGVCL